MSLFSSLTNRIFVASALLVVSATGIAIWRLTASITRQAENDLRKGLTEAASLVDGLSRSQFGDFVVKGKLIANLPVLKAAADTEHPPTVQPIAEDYQSTIGADLFVVAGRKGKLLGQAGRVRPAPAAVSEILAACRTSRDGTAFWPYAGGVLHAVAIPLVSDVGSLGTLLVGFSLDQDAAERFKVATNSDIAFALGTRIVASTLDGDRTAALATVVGQPGIFQKWLGREEYVGRVQPLGATGESDEPVALVLRSRTEHLSFLPPLRWQIAITGLAAVLVATLLGYGIARTVTRPLRALTATMREMAATGDLARKVPANGPWDDEDARLLGTTFGQLTGALDRFQREAAQRERLSSLGRLSTVVAHEIRNPLMIIKSAVRTLRRDSSPVVAETATSIDEEVTRLNRVITDVLDFAKPIRFEIASADLIEICRDAAAAASGGPDDVPILLQTEQKQAPLQTDAERLRASLVNVLGNAQHAVRARHGGAGAPPIRVRISRNDPRWIVEVVDRGAGIAKEDLARVFEPFFTTRRAGSGLGLALARNIIEGLGGSIAIESQVQTGTTVRIEMGSTQ
jgi:signal transduction histidine kinase